MKMSKIYFEANDDCFRNDISLALYKRQELLDMLEANSKRLAELAEAYAKFLDIVEKDGVHDE